MSPTVLFIRTFLRLAIGFISLLVYIRIIGRMQLSPQTPVDQIGNYVLGGIIGGIIYNVDLPIWQFFMAVIIWGSLMIIVNYIKTNNLEAKRIIEGKPIPLMENGELNVHEFQKSKISADDLTSILHQQGIATLDDLCTIWLESNGQLTLVKKVDEQLAWIVIEDGQINRIDLRRSGKTEEWVNEELKKQGIDSIKKVFIGEINKGKLKLHLYTEEYINQL